MTKLILAPGEVEDDDDFPTLPAIQAQRCIGAAVVLREMAARCRQAEEAGSALEAYLDADDLEARAEELEGDDA